MRTIDWDRSLGSFRLVCLALELSPAIVHFEAVAWKLSFVTFRLETVAWEPSIWDICLGTLPTDAWELRLRASRLVSGTRELASFLVYGTADGSWTKLLVNTSTTRELGKSEAEVNCTGSLRY